MEDVSIRRSVEDMRAKVQDTLTEKWKTIQAWSPAQRRMLLIITLLLIVNIVLVANISAPQGKLSQATRKFERSLDQANDDDESRGAIYIRWGRTVCPEETKLVYEGVTGGGLYDHHGSAANYVCLPLDPDYEYQDVSGGGYSLMYGAEYEHLNFISGKAIHDHNVPCAVCQSLSRGSVLMIPAKNKCYPGWHLEYNGYLVSSHHGHKSSKTFECLDYNPEADQAGYRNEGGALMYRVDGQCGSLPCPPYENKKAFTCSVCTK